MVKEADSSNRALQYLKEHDLAVLSTIDSNGDVHGAVVYYYIKSNNFIYILTKDRSSKGNNILDHSQVALTVYEPGTMQTVQLSGLAEVEKDVKVQDEVFFQIVKPKVYRGELQLPPVTKIVDGNYIIIRIRTVMASFHDYSK